MTRPNRGARNSIASRMDSRKDEPYLGEACGQGVNIIERVGATGGNNTTGVQSFSGGERLGHSCRQRGRPGSHPRLSLEPPRLYSPSAPRLSLLRL